MTDQQSITEFVRDAIKRHALSDLVNISEEAKEVYNTGEFFTGRTFGMAFWDGCQECFTTKIAMKSNNNFTVIRTAKGQKKPAIQLENGNFVVLHVHRVHRPEYLPKSGSAEFAKKCASYKNQLFPFRRNRSFFDSGKNKAKYHNRLVGVVCSPISGIQEIVVGELSKVGENKYQLNEMIKVNGVETSQKTEIGEKEKPDPEPDTQPKVTREESTVEAE